MVPPVNAPAVHPRKRARPQMPPSPYRFVAYLQHDRIYAHDHWSDIREVMSDPKRDGETWAHRLEDVGFEIANVIA